MLLDFSPGYLGGEVLVNVCDSGHIGACSSTINLNWLFSCQNNNMICLIMFF